MAAGVSSSELKAMDQVIARALRAAQVAGKSGIAAAVLSDDGVIAWGENEVHLLSDPTKHAEMVAITRAATQTKSTDLAGCTIVSSLQPCEMCLAAMRFAGISRVIFAATQERVPDKYFAFPHLTLADFDKMGTFEWVGGVLEDKVLQLYADGQE